MAQNSTTFPDAVDTLLETLVEAWEGFLKQLPLIVAGFAVIVATFVASLLLRRFADRLFTRFSMRESLQELLTRLARIALWIAGLTLAAMVMFPGFTPSSALTALGLVSVAVGLAFRDIFENFFAGILILWRFPFENGDFIECQEIMGRVEDVTIRDTYIRQVSGELVVMPNATLFKNPVVVLTDGLRRRLRLVVGVAYGEDVYEARAVIKKAVEACETVDRERGVEVLTSEFASSSVNYIVLWWTDPRPLQALRSTDEVAAAIKHALDEAGIEIPFPYRTLTFKEPLEIENASSGGDGGES